MSKQFQTAEELMEYLKKQIVNYSNGDELDFDEQNTHHSVSSSNSFIDLSRLSSERDANNVLWNVSAERPITSHRKIIGKFIVFFKKIARKLLRWYVSQTFELQSAFNGSVTRSINEITNTLQTMASKIEDMQNESQAQKQFVLKEQNKLFDKYDLHIKKQDLMIAELESQLSKIENNNFETIKSNLLKDLKNEFNGTMDQLKNEIIKTNENMNSIENNFKILENKKSIELNNINNQVQNNVAQLHELNKSLKLTQELFTSESNFINYRIRKLVKARDYSQSRVEFDSTPISGNIQQIKGDFDYLHFENRFRGSVEEIKKRQEAYLPYFINSSNVLDIGCGRGEFIELMIENNISVNGIDLNDDMVEFCQDKGLPVKKDDAVNYLLGVQDVSLGGIFLGQVIEHMPFDQIIIMVELAYKKLKPGSYLIMETPNPLSLAIFYRTFYVDPTHVKPIHPLTIQYVVESVGFSRTELKYSSSVEPNWWLPKLEVREDSPIHNIGEFNQGVERINNLLYGNLDYAIIAKK